MDEESPVIFTCLDCSAENTAGRRFCDQCGASLATGCPDCGGENRPEARFCGDCGLALCVNTAARLQAVAPPDTAPRGKATMQAASATVAFEEAGEQAQSMALTLLPAEAAFDGWAEEARSRFERLRAKPYLRLLEAAIEKSPVGTLGGH